MTRLRCIVRGIPTSPTHIPGIGWTTTCATGPGHDQCEAPVVAAWANDLPIPGLKSPSQ